MFCATALTRNALVELSNLLHVRAFCQRDKHFDVWNFAICWLLLPCQKYFEIWLNAEGYYLVGFIIMIMKLRYCRLRLVQRGPCCIFNYQTSVSVQIKCWSFPFGCVVKSLAGSQVGLFSWFIAWLNLVKPIPNTQ